MVSRDAISWKECRLLIFVPNWMTYLAGEGGSYVPVWSGNASNDLPANLHPS